MIKTKSKKTNSDISVYLKVITAQFLTFFILSLIAYLSDIKASHFYLISIASLSSGSVIAGFIAGKSKQRKGLVYGMLFSLPFNAAVLIISLFLNSFSFDYMAVISLILSVVLSGIGGSVSINLKKKIKVRAKR